MKVMKKLFGFFVLTMLSLPYALMAQDSGTYIDNLNVQDSSYMEQDLLAGSETASGSNTIVIIIIAVVVIAAAAYFFLRKKRK